MTDSAKTTIEPLRAGGTPESGDDIASAPLQQREAILERVCQAVLSKSGSPRAGDRG